MALDLALDGGVARPEHSANSIVGMLVTAGASMTGNSLAMQSGSTPFQWKRQPGPAVFPPLPTGGGRTSGGHQAALRRSDASARIADGPDEDDGPDQVLQQIVVVGAPEDCPALL